MNSSAAKLEETIGIFAEQRQALKGMLSGPRDDIVVVASTAECYIAQMTVVEDELPRIRSLVGKALLGLVEISESVTDLVPSDLHRSPTQWIMPSLDSPQRSAQQSPLASSRSSISVNDNSLRSSIWSMVRTVYLTIQQFTDYLSHQVYALGRCCRSPTTNREDQWASVHSDAPVTRPTR